VKKILALIAAAAFLGGCQTMSQGVKQGLRKGDQFNDWIMETVTPLK
jgi:hypothetical protein